MHFRRTIIHANVPKFLADFVTFESLQKCSYSADEALKSRRHFDKYIPLNLKSSIKLYWSSLILLPWPPLHQSHHMHIVAIHFQQSRILKEKSVNTNSPQNISNR